MSRFWIGFSIGGVCAWMAACGSDSGGGASGGPPGGMLEFDGAVLTGGNAGVGGGGGGGQSGGGTTGGGTGSGGTAGVAGSGGTAPGFVSNTPSAQVAHNATPIATGLVVTSSKLVDEPSGAEYYQLWTGLVENAGTATVCFPQVDAKFLGAGGTELASHMSFASTPPYKGASPLTISCLQPGEVGGLFSNGFAATPLNLGAITSVVFTIDAIDGDGDIPHPAAPTVSGVQFVELYGVGSGFWGATGTLIATATIYNIGLEVFPVGADGLVIERLQDHHLDTLFAGSSFAFETTTYDGTSAAPTFHTYTDFIEGAAYVSPPAKPSEKAARAEAEKHEAKRALHTHQTALARRFASRR